MQIVFHDEQAYWVRRCGQQYGSQSLAIHIPQCKEKFMKVQSMKPKADRRRLPPQPTELDDKLPLAPEAIDAFNSKMFDHYNNVSLYKCQLCGRSFNSDAFERHKKMCTPDSPGGPHAKRDPAAGTFGNGPTRLAASQPAAPSGQQAAPAATAPSTYMCYLCVAPTPDCSQN